MDLVVKEKLDLLAGRIQQMLQEQQALREEIRYYQNENRDLKNALTDLKTGMKNFPETGGKVNIAEENGSYAEKVAAITRQIDVYVEEIDRCIARLEE